MQGMEMTWKVYAIVLPLVFIAGIVDAIAGGGGLISLPAYLLAGLPPHAAIATNKLSSSFGTALTAWRFHRNRLIDWKLAIPGVIAAIIGSSIGSNLSLIVSEKVMTYLLYIILPVSAAIVLNKHLFADHAKEEELVGRKAAVISSAAALIIGIYDGFYGPGTGTFLIIAFTVFAKMGIAHANAQTKVINLTTNLTALAVFLLNGQVMLVLGVLAAICNMAGNYIGSGLAMKNGAALARPVILFVLGLLLLKVIGII